MYSLCENFEPRLCIATLWIYRMEHYEVFSFFETKRVRKKVSPEWNEKLILQQAFSVLALVQTFWDNWFRITFLRWFREIALLNKSCFYFPSPFGEFGWKTKPSLVKFAICRAFQLFNMIPRERREAMTPKRAIKPYFD